MAPLPVTDVKYIYMSQISTFSKYNLGNTSYGHVQLLRNRVYRRHFLQYGLIVRVTKPQMKVSVVRCYLAEEEVADAKRLVSELKDNFR